VVIACLRFPTGFLTGQSEMVSPQKTSLHLWQMAKSPNTSMEQVTIKVSSLITRSLAGIMLG
jgi:hypothetical protein